MILPDKDSQIFHSLNGLVEIKSDYDTIASNLIMGGRIASILSDHPGHKENLLANLSMLDHPDLMVDNFILYQKVEYIMIECSRCI